MFSSSIYSTVSSTVFLSLQVSKKRLKKYEKEYSQMKEEMELQDPAECLRVNYILFFFPVYLLFPFIFIYFSRQCFWKLLPSHHLL